VPVARDSGSVDTACLTDVLTRAGAAVTVASVERELAVRLSGGLQIVADAAIADCVGRDWAAIACPGGEDGAERLCDCAVLTELLRRQRKTGGVVAAIGESPAVIFAEHQILQFDEKATGSPTARFRKRVNSCCAGWWDAEVVADRRVITSQGPGTALHCALKIVQVLYGADKSRALASQLLTAWVPQ